MSKFERPPCPRCGTNHIVSMGKKRWQCKDCRRVFKKTLGEMANFEPVINRKLQPQKKPYVMKNPTKIKCCVCGEEHVIDNPNSEVGLFYCRECLKKHGGESVPSKLRNAQNTSTIIGVPKLEVD